MLASVASTNDIHFGVIVAGIGVIAGILQLLVRQVKHWRDETAKAVGTLAALFGDWIDEAEERIASIERERGGTVRPRSRPRRIDAMEKGLEVPPKNG